MQELLDWLRQQNGSVRVFSRFSEMALALRVKEPEHAALARLLADLAGNFSEAYYGEPLPLDVAERALARLTELVAKGVQANATGLPQQMALLNEIGASELN
jgi:hypothetical protein